VTPQAPITWQAIRLTGSDALAARASKKLRSEELMISTLGSTILRKHMDDVPLWRGNHVQIRQLVDDFGRYLYLPRLAGPQVLLQAIQDGLMLLTWPTDTFAFAEGFDEPVGRYQGLRAGQMVSISPESGALLVKPEIARRQLDEETRPPPEPAGRAEQTGVGGDASTTAIPVPTTTPPAPEPKARRFHGTVTLDTARVGRDAGRIADEVIAHLAGLVGSEVTVTLEIEARMPGGAPDHVVRTVTENARTLKFSSQGFEKE
jgi:hypothetical protein